MRVLHRKDVRGHFWRKVASLPVRHTLFPFLPPFHISLPRTRRLHESGYWSVFPDKLDPVFCFLLISGNIAGDCQCQYSPHIGSASHKPSVIILETSPWHLPDTEFCLPDMCEPLCQDSNILDDDNKRIQDLIHRFLRPRPRKEKRKINQNEFNWRYFCFQARSHVFHYPRSSSPGPDHILGGVSRERIP